MLIYLAFQLLIVKSRVISVQDIAYFVFTFKILHFYVTEIMVTKLMRSLKKSDYKWIILKYRSICDTSW